MADADSTAVEPSAAHRLAFEPVLPIRGGGLLGGLLGGLVGAVLATALWYGVVAITGWQIGLVALVVGFVVGKAVVFGAGGRGSIPLVAVSGAVTLVALVVSEYLIVHHFLVEYFGPSELFPLIQPLDVVVTVAIESVMADPLTLLFWAFAMFQAVAIPFGAMRDRS